MAEGTLRRRGGGCQCALLFTWHLSSACPTPSPLHSPSTPCNSGRFPMPTPIIVLDQLRKVFGATVAVDGVSMSIPPGEIFGFLGANGAGKTTTMRMLCGLTHATSGTGTIDGKDIWR